MRGSGRRRGFRETDRRRFRFPGGASEKRHFLGKTAVPSEEGMPDDLITRARARASDAAARVERHRDASRRLSTPLDASRRRDKKFRADGRSASARSSKLEEAETIGSRIRAAALVIES